MRRVSSGWYGYCLLIKVKDEEKGTSREVKCEKICSQADPDRYFDGIDRFCFELLSYTGGAGRSSDYIDGKG